MKAVTLQTTITEIKKDIDTRRAVEAAAQQVRADALAALNAAREARQNALDSGNAAALISADAEVNLCEYRLGKAEIRLAEAEAAPLISPDEGADYLQRVLDSCKAEALPLYDALAEAVTTCEKITAQLVDISTRANDAFGVVERAYPEQFRSKGYSSMEFRPVLVDRVISGAFYGDPAVMGRVVQKNKEILQEKAV